MFQNHQPLRSEAYPPSQLVCVYVSSYYTLKIMYILTHNNILHINEFYIYQKIFWFFYKLVLEKF